MRLNLACGTDIREHWLNLDVIPKWPVARRECEVIWDARTDRLPYADDEIDEEIYAGYLLLHLAPCYHKQVLAEILRVARPGCKVVFSEVDMVLTMEDPLNIKTCELIWGEQGSAHGESLVEFDKHCHGFTQSSLETTLQNAGFCDVHRIAIHPPEVWYELTIQCTKSGG